MSELYNLPEGWEWIELKALTNVFSDGDWIESKDQSEDGIRLIQTGNVGIGVFKDREDKSRFISEETFKLLNCTEIFESDCLISRLPEPVGRSCLIPKTELKMITSVDCTIVRFNQKVLPKLFVYYSQSNYYFKMIMNNATGATRLRISKKNLSQIPIPLPPLEEQKRIVAKLDSLFEKIDKAISLHHKNIDEANVFMSSVLNDVFRELEEKNHPMLRFDTYTNLSRGHNPPKKDFVYEEKDGYVRFIQIRDGSSDDNVVYVPFTKKLHLVTKDDLLLVAYRQIGKVFRNMEGAFNVALCKIENNDYKNLDTNYLYYLIQSKYVKDELLSKSERALIPSMSVIHLKSIEIPTPPLPIQQKIVSYLDEISQRVERLKQAQYEKRESLKALKASLLDKAFKGKL